MNRQEEILHYWFGDMSDETLLTIDSPRVKKWFGGAKNTDEEIQQLFHVDLIKAYENESLEWRKNPHGRLALILIFDQFPRHIYRGLPKSFYYDALAQDICRKTISEGWDQRLKLIERAFLYLPLMHSEDRDLQDKSLYQYRALVELVQQKFPQNADYYFYILEEALWHHRTIQRFGRFPHRNDILGRKSTPEEIIFLRQEKV